MNESWRTVRADEVRVGDMIRTSSGEFLVVTRIEATSSEGRTCSRSSKTRQSDGTSDPSWSTTTLRYTRRGLNEKTVTNFVGSQAATMIHPVSQRPIATAATLALASEPAQ